ncbi:hypothetical protein [Massilia genomosp. 1]|uniref:DUF2569 domain-containing protein n=1 Tax=Massilia genomosp. 1 TaxID=2609280 RepID=A0ABX0MXM3_9BURK|nr:hypothetical protein [Massilia genomosp. 1]NHZ65016.1 hypothetical protein [Massilia genomosp. 1]
MHNPYQSPASVAADLLQLPGKRPLSIWLLLIIVGALTIICAVATAGMVWLEYPYGTRPRIKVVFDVGWRLAAAATGLGTLLGIVGRRQWARWIAVLGMIALTALQFSVPDTAQYADNAERFGAVIGRKIIGPALMAWWIYAFAFSRKAKRYFAAPASAALAPK